MTMRIQNKKNKINKYSKLLVLTSFMALGVNNAFAQVGMVGNDPDKSAALDLKSATNKGLLMPNVSLLSTTDKTSIAGGAPVQSLMVYNTNTTITGKGASGAGFYYWDTNIWKKLLVSEDASGTGDNLGNHTATLNLNMSSNNINAANNITASGKTTTNTAQIALGTDNVGPSIGDVATAADVNGNIIWTPASEQVGSISGIYEAIGSNEIIIDQNSIRNLTNPSDLTFKLKKASYVLITYSALPLPIAKDMPTQGSIDLMIDGTKTISSYYSAADAPNGKLHVLGNYSTAQKMISLGKGTHTIHIQAKSWWNTTSFNTNPATFPYVGALYSDSQAMTTRVTAIIFNK
ncbi:hypothetical protein GKZ90_0024585 [Flavobacterium sp. MC2016-06]|jgi:hypothetical protein|uniref:hypothetical protein n=1 Tax=Flavobacterium sp. MC2016-06 TaxID=2676308 RepID=UPI0012BA7619|nr:hypothetical protein [Flavobacterium sp. MC2016-06]MBU3862088.1 hypothetical protein [Flavobacterium sp. MC2016-06]